MFEDFINAITNFKANRTRTLLSLLGILIGVMSVVIATSLGSTLYVSIAQEFKDFNMDVVVVNPRWNRSTNLPYLNIDEDYRQEVLAQIPEIKTILSKHSDLSKRWCITLKIKSLSIFPFFWLISFSVCFLN